MPNLTTRLQFIVDIREEIYSDDALVEVLTASYNSLSSAQSEHSLYVVSADAAAEAGDALTALEDDAKTLLTEETAEIEASLESKGIIFNPPTSSPEIGHVGSDDATAGDTALSDDSSDTAGSDNSDDNAGSDAGDRHSIDPEGDSIASQ